MSWQLNTELKTLNKMGADLAPKFKKLGLLTIEDLLFYFPFRYDDYSNLIKIEKLVPNILTTLRVKVELISSRRSFKKHMLITEAVVADETGQIKIIWFNQNFIAKILNIGDEIYLSGKPIITDHSAEFHNPVFEKIGKFEKATMHTNRLVPVYSSTEKLSQKQIRFLLKQILPVSAQIQEWLPQEIMLQEKFLALQQAIYQIHFPKDQATLELAKNRLKFDEIFLLQIHSGLIKKELAQLQSPKINFFATETKEFVDQLPFKLTDSQKKAAWEIIKNLNHGKPMNRLLEGDVGSGKTIAVALAIFNVLLNKLQVACMEPTEILAQQQFNVFKKNFQKYNFNIALLTSSLTYFNNEHLSKKELLKKIKDRTVDLVIGTHALIQEKVIFNNLALVVIDEQHRFGVSQRKMLKEKSQSNKNIQTMPHLLSMTATPIPRSLSLTLYGDLDLSIIDEMPLARMAIQTEIIGPEKRAQVYNFIKEQIQAGHQIFIVCPLIDPSDKLGVKAVVEEFEKLDKKIFPEISVGLLHGRLKVEEKEKIMQDFKAQKIKILVATAVIEVGIDIPNATVMMIESAERFGLSQLHQLRGRVGRSEYQSYCFLMTESESPETMRRMHAMLTAKNGFELAEKDLEFRGPGEIYGIKQSGFNDLLKIAKLTDWLLIKKAKPWVDKILHIDPTLNKFPLIKEKIKNFEMNLHFE
ncbi:MAG TPA: ATP-dependent DNA helicase RecG [bacterium]|nr:ATP-dependent DNA helicase RecG [bacterium]